MKTKSPKKLLFLEAYKLGRQQQINLMLVSTDGTGHGCRIGTEIEGEGRLVARVRVSSIDADNIKEILAEARKAGAL